MSSTGNQLEPVNEPQSAANGGSHRATTIGFPETMADIVARARTSVTAGQFFREALACISRYFASPYGALYVRYASEVLQEEHHAGPTDPRFWRESVQSFLTDSLSDPRPRAKLLRAKSGKMKLAYLSCPIFDPSGPANGAVALVVSPGDEADLTGLLASLESMTRVTSFAVEFVGRGSAPDDAHYTATGNAASMAQAQTLRRAASCETVEELAFSLTNELCSKLGCEQVALGLVRGHNVRIVSISGLDDVPPRSPGAAAIRAAMEECLDANTIIVAGGGGDWSGEAGASGYRLHRQWQTIARGDAVASMPLKAGDETAAVISLRRPAAQPFDAAQLAELHTKVELYAPALRLLRRASRGLLRHGVDTIRDAARAVITPGHTGARVLIAAVVLMLGFVMFGTMNYKVTVACVVRPAESRHLAAPYDALIASSLKIAGDKVSAGEILCALNHRELDQQQAQLLAEMAVWETSKDQAMAASNPVNFQLAVAQQQLVRTKLVMVQHRLEQADVRAPFDGMVVRGDLRKRVGSVVARGEPLFEIAPLTAWTLELHAPESAAADLAPGQTGLFAAFGRPNQQVTFLVDRVLESTQVVDGRNVVLAEADIQATEEWLRPGMEGVARVQIAPRRVWWIALHRAIEYLQVNFWL